MKCATGLGHASRFIQNVHSQQCARQATCGVTLNLSTKAGNIAVLKGWHTLISYIRVILTAKRRAHIVSYGVDYTVVLTLLTPRLQQACAHMPHNLHMSPNVVGNAGEASLSKQAWALRSTMLCCRGGSHPQLSGARSTTCTVWQCPKDAPHLTYECRNVFVRILIERIQLRGIHLGIQRRLKC
jgi:hypothetical protein